MKYAHMYALFLVFVFHTSCGGQNKTGQAKSNTQPIESGIGATRLVDPDKVRID